MSTSVYWIVFKRSEDAELEAIAVSSDATVATVDSLVGGVGWSLSSKATSTEAIQEAMQQGVEYCSPQDKDRLTERIATFRSTV